MVDAYEEGFNRVKIVMPCRVFLCYYGRRSVALHLNAIHSL